MTTVTIIYKSGQKVRVKVKSFTAVHSITGGLKEVKWTDMKPSPLFINPEEIESIWDGKV